MLQYSKEQQEGEIYLKTLHSQGNLSCTLSKHATVVLTAFRKNPAINIEGKVPTAGMRLPFAHPSCRLQHSNLQETSGAELLHKNKPGCCMGVLYKLLP